MLEYKVVTESDSRFSGRFDVESLEATLNSYAAEGWRVIEGLLAANLAKSMKAQLVIILGWCPPEWWGLRAEARH